MTDQTVVVTDHPPPHTEAMEDMTTGEAGGLLGARQVLLADLTDRILHDPGLAGLRLGLITGRRFLFLLFMVN